MSANFDRAFAIVIGIEAGYVNDPKDQGGETKYGISKRQYPDVDIKNLTIDQAKAIYLRDFWNTHDLDALEYGKALLVFDVAVNGGSHARWYSMYGGYSLEDFAVAFQAEHMIYLASLPGWIHDGRGWARRAFKIFSAAIAA